MNRSACDRSIAQVYYYLDGEITWFKRLRVRRHLRKCRDCSSAFSFETRLKEVVRERIHEEPEPEVIARLRRFLKDNESEFGG